MNAEDVSRFERPVVCAWCNNKHRSMYPEGVADGCTTVGDGCSTDVYQVNEKIQAHMANKGVIVEVGDWMANGHYGDNWLDCTLWKWVQNFPTAEADPICNNCLGERIKAKDLVQIEGNFP